MSTGLDSLAATELTEALSVEFGLDLSPTALFDHPTHDSMVSFLWTRINRSLVEPTLEKQLTPYADEGKVITAIVAESFELAGLLSSSSGLRLLRVNTHTASSHVPAA